jgi:hypothetical protein
MGPLEHATKGLEQATGFYSKDLEALSEDQIFGCAGGVARRPADFTYEVCLINRRVAARLRGEEPPAWPEGEGFVGAPADLSSKASIATYFADACAELMAAAKAIPAEEGDKLIGPEGKQEPAYAMVSFCAMHTMYHDAQLNFVQSLAGDGGMHWF